MTTVFYKIMRCIIIAAILILYLQSVQGQQIIPQKGTDSQLAIKFYNSGNYEKAIPLLRSLYKKSSNNYYFRIYIDSYIKTGRFSEAEVEINREIKKRKNASTEMTIYLGYVLDGQGRCAEAQVKYEEAIQGIPPNKGNFLSTANTFMQLKKYGYAVQTYLKGRSEIGEQFSNELARAYMYNRDYKKMLEEYLDLLGQDEKSLAIVQSRLAAVMRVDIYKDLQEQFRGQILKRIQAEPNVTGYNRLLIWLFLQGENFSGALRQSIALDKRTGGEDLKIAQLGQMAMNSKRYGDAQKAYGYLLAKGEVGPYYKQAYAQDVHVSYLQYINSPKTNLEEGRELSVKFNGALDYLTYSPSSLNLILEYAHLLAFYLDDHGEAVKVLQKGLEIPRLDPGQTGMLKTEMADIYVYSGDLWEAMLVYSQVIDANKMNPLGDQVKLKKAKLGYYMGNFSWAKAQLDVLKASTSKLTANDAMDLSLLIGNNLNLDTTATPLEMFARADLLFFRNMDSLALATLDSIIEMFPYNPLDDDILFRKSKIEIGKQDYKMAATYLGQIIEGHSYGPMADDALFELANLYNHHLGNKEKARDLYKQMLFNYPGSIYVEESRKLYRELREAYPDDVPAQEGLFNEGGISNEFD